MNPQVLIVVPDGGSEGMALEDLATMAHQQNMSMLQQSGVIAHENFIQVGKYADLSYLHNQKVVSLPEALGAREVGSKSVPAGPTVLQ